MSELMCHYSGDREQAIVSYLYGDDADFDRGERAGFEAHLQTCARCRTDVEAFGEVREALGSWSPPLLQSADRPSLGRVRLASDDAEDLPAASHARGAAAANRSWWRAMPVWAQTAAALLCVGVAAGVANLDVRYDAEGLRVRTGWMSVPESSGGAAAATAAATESAWRAEMSALEARLRAELRAPAANAVQNAGPLRVPDGVNAATAPATPEALRRVRALVDESERRQQRELALRLAEAVRDMNAQRQADLTRIDRNIGAIQNNTGREMQRQRSEMLNYVAVRTAAQRPQ
jgi:hypothetical protein